jgi:pimeloyl-ACP methyl ester carboxylesterase
MKSTKAFTELVPIYTNLNGCDVEIIFIHGLNGDPITSWGFDEPAWTPWIISRFPNARIWSLRYRIRWSWWNGGSIALADRAISVLATIDGQLVDKTPIVLICHSYGGLLAKQMLRSGHERGSEYERLVGRIAGVVFLGTPHNGAAIAGFVEKLGPILRARPAISELKQNAALLRDLSAWFTKNAQHYGWTLRVFRETEDTFGVRVVTEDDSNPHVANVGPIAVDGNHFEICMPHKNTDVRVTQTLMLISSVIDDEPTINSQSFMQQVLIAPDSDLSKLKRELEGRVARNPRDGAALRVLDHISDLQDRTRS